MLILLDGKKRRDGHLFGKNKGAKVGKAFSKDIFLIILLHKPSFCLFGIGIGICRENYIRKGRENNSILGINIANKIERANNPSKNTNPANIDGGVEKLGRSTDTADIDRGANLNKNINKADINRRANNPGIDTTTADIDRGTNLNTNTNIVDVDKNIDKLGTRIANAIRRENNFGISARINGKADNISLR